MFAWEGERRKLPQRSHMGIMRGIRAKNLYSESFYMNVNFLYKHVQYLRTDFEATMKTWIREGKIWVWNYFCSSLLVVGGGTHSNIWRSLRCFDCLRRTSEASDDDFSREKNANEIKWVSRRMHLMEFIPHNELQRLLIGISAVFKITKLDMNSIQAIMFNCVSELDLYSLSENNLLRWRLVGSCWWLPNESPSLVGVNDFFCTQQLPWIDDYDYRPRRERRKKSLQNRKLY